MTCTPIAARDRAGCSALWTNDVFGIAEPKASDGPEITDVPSNELQAVLDRGRGDDRVRGAKRDAPTQSSGSHRYGALYSDLVKRLEERIDT